MHTETAIQFFHVYSQCVLQRSSENKSNSTCHSRQITWHIVAKQHVKTAGGKTNYNAKNIEIYTNVCETKNQKPSQHAWLQTITDKSNCIPRYSCGQTTTGRNTSK